MQLEQFTYKTEIKYIKVGEHKNNIKTYNPVSIPEKQ